MERVKVSNIGGGTGLGQDTGKDALANGKEAREILAMICAMPTPRATTKKVCGDLAAEFVAAQVERSSQIVTHFTISGKQLFWLRDIKDKLVNAGEL